MILVRNIRLAPDEDAAALKPRAAKKLRTAENEITALKLVKRSLDARRKDDIHYVCSVAISLRGDEKRCAARAKNKDVADYTPHEYTIPRVDAPRERPVIVGFGPAGMFAALVLAYAGARPIVIERGRDALRRKAAVEAFRAGGALDTECNVQFGEGGAGTFSDGKLNTGTHDRRMNWVLEQFYAHGANESVLYDAKPHIGTDVLIDIVQRIRADVIAHGGEVRFETRLDRLCISDGRLTGAVVTAPDGQYEIACSQLILAVGHSARDTFEALLSQGVEMQPKPFSMGVRIEHKQSCIDDAQYGENHPSTLPVADYSLNVHLPDGTSAYTFCMCPGGEVFAAASEQGGVVTNGMSYSRRDGENANSALLVTLTPEDFPDKSTLGGMYWQREIERAAFHCGGDNYLAPAQTVGDFLEHRASHAPMGVQPSYRPGVVWCDLHEVLPRRITAVLENALPQLGRRLSGFDAPEAVMTAPETRSSSPVRIVRDARLQSGVAGLYPCGEGAGYAGGISSAAVDGMRCAEAVLRDIEDGAGKSPV